jgi:CheY-like chemotaxis protein
MELHGRTMRRQSGAPDKVDSVTLKRPRTCTAERPPLAPVCRPQKGSMNPSPRILIVDDDPDQRLILRYQLRSIGVVAHLEATDGHQAFEQVAHGAPLDLIIMDFRLPECNGWEATRRIRALPGPRRSLPILAYTAAATATTEQEARAAGCDDYLTKPLLDVTLLQQKITQLLARGSIPNGAPF